MDTLKDGLRHDPAKLRQSVRYGRQKGVTIYVSAADLIAAGIDPDGPPPKYRLWGSKTGGLRGRLYTE